MNKFKVGDRVKIYHKDYIWIVEIEDIDGDIIVAITDYGSELFHYKQCRKLVKKKKNEPIICAGQVLHDSDPTKCLVIAYNLLGEILEKPDRQDGTNILDYGVKFLGGSDKLAYLQRGEMRKTNLKLVAADEIPSNVHNYQESRYRCQQVTDSVTQDDVQIALDKLDKDLMPFHEVEYICNEIMRENKEPYYRKMKEFGYEAQDNVPYTIPDVRKYMQRTYNESRIKNEWQTELIDSYLQCEATLKNLVEEQEEDEALWVNPKTATEAYIQVTFSV